jgi:hypothetical protein
LKLPKRLKTLLILSFGSVYGAGTLYWISRLYLKTPGEFGPEPHWLERLAGPIHVTAAFLFLFVMGMLWPQHVTPAIKLRKHRLSGWLLLAIMSALIGTGVTILYAGEAGMKLAGEIHPWIGQGLFATLLFHSLKRLKSKASIRLSKPRSLDSKSPSE